MKKLTFTIGTQDTYTKEQALERYKVIDNELKRLRKRVDYLYDLYQIESRISYNEERKFIEEQIKNYEQEQHQLCINYSIIDGELVNTLLATWYYNSSFTVEEIEDKLINIVFKKFDDTRLTWTFLYKCDLNSRCNCGDFTGDKKFADLLRSNPKEFAKFIKYSHWKELHKDKGIPYDMQHVFSYLCRDYKYIEGRSHALGFGKHWYNVYNKKGQCYRTER